MNFLLTACLILSMLGGLSVVLLGWAVTLCIIAGIGFLAVLFVMWVVYLADNDPTFHNECRGA